MYHSELFEPKVKLHLVVNYGQLRQGNPRQAKKKSGTPTATTVPEMRQKNNPKLRYITCSYMRFFILRTPLRFGENTLKKAYNQIMYNSRTRSTLCPLRCPKSLKISPPPISCAENKKHVVICLPCACSIWFPFSLHSVPGAAFVPRADPWYFITLSFQSYTSAPRGFGKYSFPFRKLHSLAFSPSLFPRISNGMFFISATSLPH